MKPPLTKDCLNPCMRPLFKSFLTASAVTLAVHTCTVGVVAPRLGRSVAAVPAVTGAPHYVKPAAGKVELVNNDGAVVVTTHSADTIDVRARYRVYTMAKGMEELAASYGESLVKIEEVGDVLRIVTEPGERPEGLEVIAEYVVSVPNRTDLELRNANGNVTVAKGAGAITVRGRNSDVLINGAEGPVAVRSTNGRIRVVDAEAGAELETVNGNIYAHVSGGSLNADTTNGQIVARLLDRNVETCDLTTRNGGISVVLSPDSSAQLEARTARGAVNRGDVAVDVSNGIDRRRHLRGLIGDGRTALTMDSLNGNIMIMRSVP